MQANPNCIRQVGDFLFQIHGSAHRQRRNTRAAASLMRDVLADGRIAEHEIPKLQTVQQLLGAEHAENELIDREVAQAQEYTVRAEDLIYELTGK